VQASTPSTDDVPRRVFYQLFRYRQALDWLEQNPNYSREETIDRLQDALADWSYEGMAAELQLWLVRSGYPADRAETLHDRLKPTLEKSYWLLRSIHDGQVVPQDQIRAQAREAREAGEAIKAAARYFGFSISGLPVTIGRPGSEKAAGRFVPKELLPRDLAKFLDIP
jgi:hypothetical protein